MLEIKYYILQHILYLSVYNNYDSFKILCNQYKVSDL